MITTAHPTPSSAAAPTYAPASPALELLEARRLRDSLKTLLRAEQSAMAAFLVALADFDRRRGWEALGHASLFAFLVADLGLSTSSTYWRQSAARLLQDFPELERPLRMGRLCLTTMAELAKVLTEENRDSVLPRFLGISSRAAKEIVAELQPREAPPLRAVVTAVPPPALKLEPAPASASALLGFPISRPGTPPIPEAGLAPAADRTDADPESFRAPEMKMTHPARGVTWRDDVEPLSAELRRLHITVSRQFLQELESAKDGLSHAVPNATTEQVLQAALRLLLEKQGRARGQVKRPRALRPEIQSAIETSNVTSTPSQTPAEHPPHRREGSRGAIPAAVRRAVWARDGGRCNWPLDGGGRCGSTHRLELDHILPWAEWGGETEANLRVVCAVHNRLAARQAFGERLMARYLGAREPVAAYAAVDHPSACAG